jgi:hypothetical protein
VIKDDHFIDEVIHCFKTRDLIKSKILLRELDQVSTKASKRLFFELSRAQHGFSIPLLIHILVNLPDLSESLPELEALLIDTIKTMDSASEIYAYLNSPEEQLAFIKAMGSKKDEESCQFLIGLLRSETNKNFIISLLDALGQLGNPTYVSSVADFLYSTNLEIVFKAIQTLGCCPSEQTFEVLRTRVGNDQAINNCVVEALLTIRSESSVALLADFLGSP